MNESIFSRIGKKNSHEMSTEDVMRQYKSLNGNRDKIFEMMMNNGYINAQQYSDLRGVQNPMQAIQYLINCGAMNRNPIMKLLGKQ